ncbi:MAG: hypothetical protein EPO32_13315 [Anaerolineae bacterium]|nr:MAG: hypothetical protein EPO32_13315 [Anaerolineae bacterium]
MNSKTLALLERSLHRVLTLLVAALLIFPLGPATLPPSDTIERIRAYTRAYEFDYEAWTFNAFRVKVTQNLLDTERYLDLDAQRQVVLDYLALVEDIQRTEDEIATLYADPNLPDPDAATAEARARLDALAVRRADLGPLTESILQAMVATVAADFGLTLGGQPVPPVLYHSTPLPWALIVSPRDRIEQIRNISLQTETTLEQHIELEDAVAAGLDYSTLVVPVGGIGTYPTMVIQTTNLNFLVEVVAHEWIHNYLTLRPLGFLYDATPELRTMNETTANIAGKEIGAELIRRYFPEFAPPPPAPPAEPAPEPENTAPPPPTEPPPFDFRAEMHETRLTVDGLLAQGKIEEAEAYMEARRQFFWDNGYRIRKLNQAYFAFYGAYADVPGGAAGEDPVGAAVRDLRAGSADLEAFIDSIAWLTSFEALLETLAE